MAMATLAVLLSDGDSNDGSDCFGSHSNSDGDTNDETPSAPSRVDRASAATTTDGGYVERLRKNEGIRGMKNK